MVLAKIAALLLLGTAWIRAEDITLTDGTVFKNAKVVSYNEKSVTISFAAGVAMVKIELVPPSLLLEPILKNFPGTEASAAVAPVTPMEISPKIKEATDKGQLQASGSVVQSNSDGLIVRLGTYETNQVQVPHTEEKTVNIVPEGLGHTPVNKIIVNRWTTTETVSTRKELGTVFVACKTDDATEEDGTVGGTYWNGNVWHVGTCTYVDNDQVRHTVDRYTTYPKEAYEYFAAHPAEIPAPTASPHPNPETKSTPVQTSTSLSTGLMNH